MNNNSIGEKGIPATCIVAGIFFFERLKFAPCGQKKLYRILTFDSNSFCEECQIEFWVKGTIMWTV